MSDNRGKRTSRLLASLSCVVLRPNATCPLEPGLSPQHWLCPRRLHLATIPPHATCRRGSQDPRGPAVPSYPSPLPRGGDTGGEDPPKPAFVSHQPQVQPTLNLRPCLSFLKGGWGEAGRGVLTRFRIPGPVLQRPVPTAAPGTEMLTL